VTPHALSGRGLMQQEIEGQKPAARFAGAQIGRESLTDLAETEKTHASIKIVVAHAHTLHDVPHLTASRPELIVGVR
jgi:hypothetical protein